MSNEEFVILKKAIAAWGAKAQCDMMIEECAELIQALSKYDRADESNLQKRYENVAEEIADVSILIDQMKLLFNNAELVETYRQQKILRLANRLTNQKP